MVILILTTGGTIDNLDYDMPENYPEGHKSLIPELLSQARVTSKYRVEELMSKDSRFINDVDRAVMVSACETATEEQILISHGTLSMVETAKYIGQKKISKSIILFGSHIPAINPNSDALANLGAAITAIQILEHGVYIAMNGSIFTWDNVQKNMVSETFERIRS